MVVAGAAVLALLAGHGSRPLTTANASTRSRAISSRRRVSSMLRCSVCAESVNIRPPSRNATIAMTMASSTREKPLAGPRGKAVTG
jgi:hypothetical protein